GVRDGADDDPGGSARPAQRAEPAHGVPGGDGRTRRDRPGISIFRGAHHAAGRPADQTLDLPPPTDWRGGAEVRILKELEPGRVDVRAPASMAACLTRHFAAVMRGHSSICTRAMSL